MNNSIRTVMSFEVQQPAMQVYGEIANSDPRAFFLRHRMIPGIMEAHSQGSWSRPGDTRTIYFDNFSTANEVLLVVIPGFLLRTSFREFTSSFGWLVKEVNFSCTLCGNPGGHTQVSAEFIFVARNTFSSLLFKLFISKMIRRYITGAVGRIQNNIVTRVPATINI